MPRIRSLKPEFWGDEKLAPLAAIDRLVFLGLIGMADDAGRLVDNLKSIDGFIFPSSDDSSRDALDTLARLSRIIRYTSASNQRLIQIRYWSRHQRVDNPSKYVLPAPPDTSLEDRERSEFSRDTSEGVARVSPSDPDPDPDPDQDPDLGDSSSSRERLLALVPDRRAWEGELQVAMDGGYGAAFKATADQVEIACRDYLGNGHGARPNLAHFRAHLRRIVAATKGDTTSASGKGKRSLAPAGSGSGKHSPDYGEHFK